MWGEKTHKEMEYTKDNNLSWNHCRHPGVVYIGYQYPLITEQCRAGGQRMLNRVITTVITPVITRILLDLIEFSNFTAFHFQDFGGNKVFNVNLSGENNLMNNGVTFLAFGKTVLIVLILNWLFY